jgi:hypothetical protein
MGRFSHTSILKVANFARDFARGCIQTFGRIEEIALAYDVVPLKDRARFVTCASPKPRRCFRHQLLLRHQRHPRFIINDQDGRLSELDFLRKPKKQRRREDLP